MFVYKTHGTSYPEYTKSYIFVREDKVDQERFMADVEKAMKMAIDKRYEAWTRMGEPDSICWATLGRLSFEKFMIGLGYTELEYEVEYHYDTDQCLFCSDDADDEGRFGEGLVKRLNAYAKAKGYRVGSIHEEHERSELSDRKRVNGSD